MRLDKVAKRYGIRRPWVVREVSLEIPAGALVRFEGENGSGKSTLLRLIAGVCEPSRGRVSGRPVTGYVPERFPPALPFPAREYLSHIGRVHALTGPDLDSRIDGCLDRLGGRELGTVPLRNMSKGMCQKIAVAQALLPRSGLLVLDEAWTGLDAEAKHALDEAVAGRLAAGGSVVFVDHEPGRLAHLGARRWRLADGYASPVAGDGDQATVAGDGDQATAAGTPPEVVVIEAAGSVPEVGKLPGVLSVRRDGGRVIVRAEAGSSDAVLRRLLGGGETAAILRVGREPAAREPAGREPAGREPAAREPAGREPATEEQPAPRRETAGREAATETARPEGGR